MVNISFFAYPHIGNYPLQKDKYQSEKTHTTCVIAREFSNNPYWDELDVPLITGIDTRALVQYLTKTDDQKSLITFSKDSPSAIEFEKAKLKCSDLNLVGQNETTTLIPGEKPIVIINYGIKKAIVDNFKNFNKPLVMASHKITADEVMALNPRLLFLSNGPGDPRDYLDQVKSYKRNS